MATRDLTEADFETTLSENDIVLVDFWAEWCGPCRQFAPVFEDASEKHSDVVFGKIDTEAERGLAAAAQVSSIPTLMAFREGVLVFNQPGALPATTLDQVIEAVKALDMTEVHAQVANQRAMADKPREVSQEDFVEIHASGAKVIDVREAGEYATAHVPGAVLVPLSVISQRFQDDVPAAGEGPVYVICASGNRSLQATDFLRSHGIEAYSVAGGTNAWRLAGRDVVTGTEPTATA